MVFLNIPHIYARRRNRRGSRGRLGRGPQPRIRLDPHRRWHHPDVIRLPGYADRSTADNIAAFQRVGQRQHAIVNLRQDQIVGLETDEDPSTTASLQGMSVSSGSFSTENTFISVAPDDLSRPLPSDSTIHTLPARSSVRNFNRWFSAPSGYTSTIGPHRPHPQNYPYRGAAGGSSR